MPLAATLGIELEEATADLVRGRLQWKPELCTAGGLLHGGALMALADSCGAVCAFLNLPEGATGTTTIESKTNLLRAVREGVVTATTTPLHRGRTLAVLETELTDAEGKLVAKTTQSQQFLR
jgi:1,4-dihydroxy-2-naphthoyl-CoA hydrolase